MSQNILDFVPASCELLGLGEPSHQEPAFPLLRNGLFAQLAAHGFRSIALETDRVAALAVNAFVQHGEGTLDAAMSEGFSHGWGALDANRQLVAWMREYNQSREPQEQLAFHGFDAATENTSAPSPRRYLEYARDYLNRRLSAGKPNSASPQGRAPLSPGPAIASPAAASPAVAGIGVAGPGIDIAGLAGDDEKWGRDEAILDAAMSPGASDEAGRLRVIADDLLTALYERAPELIAATSRAEWFAAKTYLTTGLGLLRYHQRAAQPLERSARISRLLGMRDVLMAQNLLDIRGIEAHRGATLVFAHNRHLQLDRATMRIDRDLQLQPSNNDIDLNWSGAGAIIAALGQPYTFIACSLGRSNALRLGEPEPDTYEGFLQGRITSWGLTPAATLPLARTRAGTVPQLGYFPLDQQTVAGADAILHINNASSN